MTKEKDFLILSFLRHIKWRVVQSISGDSYKYRFVQI
jgi:hypothetical protein